MQVYLNNKYVGNYQASFNSHKMSEFVIRKFVSDRPEFLKEGPILIDDAAIEKIVIKVGSISRIVEAETLEEMRDQGRLDQFYLLSNIPKEDSSLEEIKDFSCRGVRFSWKVLAPTLEQYEEMFDMPNFTPV